MLLCIVEKVSKHICGLPSQPEMCGFIKKRCQYFQEMHSKEINQTRHFSFSQDQYSADLYHFATKEDEYASYFIRVSTFVLTQCFSTVCSPTGLSVMPFFTKYHVRIVFLLTHYTRYHWSLSSLTLWKCPLLQWLDLIIRSQYCV